MHHKLSIFVLLGLGGTAAAQAPSPTSTPASPAPVPATAPAAEAPVAADPAAPAPADPAAEPAPAEPVAAEPAMPVPPVEPPPASKKDHPAKVGYEKGFYIRTDDDRYELKIESRFEPYFTSKFSTDDPDFQNAFQIRRARTTFGGHMHTKALGYKLQIDYGKGFVSLKDFYTDIAFSKALKLRAGQWKRPFSRQQINSSGKLELTDRSITDKAFGAGRDIGVALHNGYEKSPDLEWAIGVFNGTGDGSHFKPTTNADGEVTGGSFSNVPSKFRPVVVARVGINRGGISGYSEADLEGGPLRYAVAADVALEGDNDDNDQSNQKASVDYVVKASGFSTTGAFYMMTAQDDLKLTDFELSHLGFYVQAGYMVSKHGQVAARYSLVDARLDGGTDQQEIAVGGTYYALGHNAKLVGAVRLIKDGDASFTDGVNVEIGANLGF